MITPLALFAIWLANQSATVLMSILSSIHSFIHSFDAINWNENVPTFFSLKTLHSPVTNVCIIHFMFLTQCKNISFS